MDKKYQYYIYQKKPNMYIIADGYDHDVIGLRTFETHWLLRKGGSAA
jgi:hypothetical protein